MISLLTVTASESRVLSPNVYLKPIHFTIIERRIENIVDYCRNILSYTELSMLCIFVLPKIVVV